jgi:hypothetical protein
VRNCWRRADYRGRGSEDLAHLPDINNEKYRFAIDLSVCWIGHVANPLVDRDSPIGRPNVKGRPVDIEDGVPHSVTVGQRLRDLQSRVGDSRQDR